MLIIYGIVIFIVGFICGGVFATDDPDREKREWEAMRGYRKGL